MSISLIAHLSTIALWALITMIGNSGDHVYFKPIYTTVSVVESPEKKTKKKSPKKPAVKKPAVSAPKPAVKPAEKPAERTKAQIAADAKKIDDALSSLEESLAAKEAEAAIAARMDALAAKQAAEQARLEEEALAREIAELRRQLEESGSSKVEPKTPTTQKERSGEDQEVFDLKFSEYYSTIGTLIQAAWIYPGGNAPKDLQTILSLRIASSGELKHVTVERRSGNTIFDESAAKAVKKASPLPKPPKEILDGEFLDIGIRFCPEGCN